MAQSISDNQKNADTAPSLPSPLLLPEFDQVVPIDKAEILGDNFHYLGGSDPGGR